MTAKKVILFHGTGDTPQSFWLPYAAKHLKQRGYEVMAPLLPDEEARLSKWLPFALESFIYDQDTILIGHSAGATLILSILENIETKIGQAIMVGGFHKPLRVGPRHPILQDNYDWQKIKSHCQDLIIINSDNDPWGCDDKMGREMADQLDATLIVPKGEGHMGSNVFNQPYPEFPLLLELVK